MNIKATKKMLACYFIVIFLPFIGISLFFYYKTSADIFHEYSTNKQKILEQEYSNFKVKLSNIEYLYRFFQYTPAILDYLSGFYLSDADETYAYIKEIAPIFTQTKRSSPMIKDITIYKRNKNFITLNSNILDNNSFDLDPGILIGVKPGKGVWLFDHRNSQNLRFNYYQNIYNAGFQKVTGFIEIKTDADLLFSDFQMNRVADKAIYCINDNCYTYDKGHLTAASGQMEYKAILDKRKSRGPYFVYTDGKSKMLVNTLTIKELGTTVIVLTPYSNIITTKGQFIFLVYIGFFLVLLSAIYYTIMYSVIIRITGLSRHIKDKCHDDSLVEYNDKDYRDEIGLLVGTFNSMVRRINNLIHTVYKTDIERKEAEFYALQAQIKPHFLYNTLESIRMTAEINEDTEAADMAFTLGKFIRYNVARNRSEVLLKNEIDNIANYLKLFKKRKGMRFDYKTHILCDIEGYTCPFFILQPLVENAIVHGLTDIRGKESITVSVTEESDALMVVITDNGKGIEKNQLEVIKEILNGERDISEFAPERNGIGIFNVHERVKRYYGERFGLSIESTSGQGTVCSLRIGKRRKDDTYESIHCRR